MVLRVVLFLNCILPILLQAEGKSMEPPRSQFTARDLRSALAQAQEKIQSFRVKYRGEYYTDPRSPKNSYLYRIVAAKFPSSFYRVNSHPSDEFDVENDPKRQIAYIQDRVAVFENPFTASYSIISLEPDSVLPGPLALEFFYSATGIWPLLRKAPFWNGGKVPVALRDVAASNDYSEVRPLQEKVNGRWCHVLSWPKTDSLWLDVDQGCALLCRETFSETGAKIQRFELSQHRQYAPDCWLPTLLRNMQFDPDALTEEARGRVVIDAYFTVEELELNTVPDTLFEFKPSAGALLIFDDRSTERDYPKQTVAHGHQMLDRLAKWTQSRASRRGNTSWWNAYGAFICVPILLMAVFLEFRRRARSTNRNSVP
jgi:hypothetical protein